MCSFGALGVRFLVSCIWDFGVWGLRGEKGGLCNGSGSPSGIQRPFGGWVGENIGCTRLILGH